VIDIEFGDPFMAAAAAAVVFQVLLLAVSAVFFNDQSPLVFRSVIVHMTAATAVFGIVMVFASFYSGWSGA
jgi:hypothetical protein